MIKLKTGLFGNFSSKEERSKVRCKSIASIKSSKSRTLNSTISVKKPSTLSRIYTQKISPEHMTRKMIESITQKHSSASKLNVLPKPEKQQKAYQDFIQVKDETLHKIAHFNNKTINISYRKKRIKENHPSICIEESNCNTVVTNDNSATIKPTGQSDAKGSIKSIMSSSLLEGSSVSQSFHSQAKKKECFKSKVAKIFEKFKDEHLDIMIRFNIKKHKD